MAIYEVLVAFRANPITDMNSSGSNDLFGTRVWQFIYSPENVSLFHFCPWKMKVDTKSTASPEINSEEFKSGFKYCLSATITSKMAKTW